MHLSRAAIGLKGMEDEEEDGEGDGPIGKDKDKRERKKKFVALGMATGEGPTMVRDLQDMKVSMDEKMKGGTIRMFAGSKPLLPSDVDPSKLGGGGAGGGAGEGKGEKKSMGLGLGFGAGEDEEDDDDDEEDGVGAGLGSAISRMAHGEDDALRDGGDGDGPEGDEIYSSRFARAGRYDR